MKAAITLLMVSILCLTMTVTMFGVSKQTSAELDREIRWEQTHQAIR